MFRVARQLTGGSHGLGDEAVQTGDHAVHGLQALGNVEGGLLGGIDDAVQLFAQNIVET